MNKPSNKRIRNYFIDFYFDWVTREIQRRKQQVWCHGGMPGGCKSPECFHNGKTFVTAGKMPIFISLETHKTFTRGAEQKKNYEIYTENSLYTLASGCYNQTSFQITVDCSFVAEVSKYWQRAKNVQKAIKLRFEKRL